MIKLNYCRLTNPHTIGKLYRLGKIKQKSKRQKFQIALNKKPKNEHGRYQGGGALYGSLGEKFPRSTVWKHHGCSGRKVKKFTDVHLVFGPRLTPPLTQVG